MFTNYHTVGINRFGQKGYWETLHAQVNGEVNSWYTSIALGRPVTSELERFVHFCHYGGMAWFIATFCC
jgi:hypothetical protein